MRPLLDLKHLAGYLSVAAALMLSSPGVSVVRAEGAEPAPQRAADAPACSVDAGAPDPVESLEQVRRDALARLQELPSEDRPVALDNSGYNYPTGSGIERVLNDLRQAQQAR